MVPALLVLALLFGFFFLTRVGGAYRYELLRRWPAALLAGAAIFMLARGALWPALAFASMAAFVWVVWPRIDRPNTSGAARPDSDPGDAEARAILGVGAHATASEIRSAYRTKMARAHPDRGGAHNEAARLTAARDRLLKKMR